MKCRHCKVPFKPTEFLAKFCKQTDDCKVAFGLYVVGKQKAKQQKEWKDRKKGMADQLKTHSDWCKELQIEINTIVRLIDKGSVCISSLKPLNEKYDAGHRFSCGAWPSIRFHLFNIHAQSVNQNQYLSGNPDGYDHGISCIYGYEYLKEVHGLREKYPTLKLTIPELIQAKARAKNIVKELKYYPIVTDDPELRVKLRAGFNKRIGIYKP
jgi:hypothetical protein